MIHGGIKQGIHSRTVDTTLRDLEKFQEFFIEIENLEFSPIFSQIETYSYNAVKVLPD